MKVRTYLILGGSGEEKHKSKVNTSEDSQSFILTVTRPADLPQLCDKLCEGDAVNAVTKICD